MSKVEPYVLSPFRNPWRVAALVAALMAVGCGEEPPAETEVEAQEDPAPAPIENPSASEPEVELEDPVPVWEDGAIAREVEASEAAAEGLMLLELGEDWTPYLFTERDRTTGERIPNAYRNTYLRLARGEFPDDHHGERARRDKYLELYGIMPTVGTLRDRLAHASELECAADLDLTPLRDFDGFVSYRDNDRARRNARRFLVLERQVATIAEREGAEAKDLDLDALSTRDAARVRDYLGDIEEVRAIRAAQERLECEGYYEGKGDYQAGGLDWPTHEALAEFERRHRVYGWGFLGRETLDRLRESPVEVEREAVLRVLTERAMHAAGVIEDGSRSTRADGEPRTFRGADGEQHPIPNLEAELRQILISAFGLDTPDSTLSFLQGLGDLEPGGSKVIAVRRPELPEYYSPAMPLEVEIDRGDVWYEFPYDAEGRERAQPRQRRPRLTIYTRYRDQRIPLARFGTTIGGWRSEVVDGVSMWKFKVSEIGPRVWHRIVASPVWLPPESTPARDLLHRARNRRRGDPRYAVNLHEVGPSYASAYGLVAAYHQRFLERADGTVRLGGDEGIRTHGSVDYMSIMRRHSHGCHRLHNHIAVRLMSYVLTRRPHRRVGQQRLSFRRELEHDDDTYLLAIDEGGYQFELEEPLRVNVLEGRIRGRLSQPIPHPMPKFDDEVGAYVMPDGQTVSVDRMGNITPITLEVLDADVDGGPDAGVDGGPGTLTTDQLIEALPL